MLLTRNSNTHGMTQIVFMLCSSVFCTAFLLPPCCTWCCQCLGQQTFAYGCPTWFHGAQVTKLLAVACPVPRLSLTPQTHLLQMTPHPLLQEKMKIQALKVAAHFPAAWGTVALLLQHHGVIYTQPFLSLPLPPPPPPPPLPFGASHVFCVFTSAFQPGYIASHYCMGSAFLCIAHIAELISSFCVYLAFLHGVLGWLHGVLGWLHGVLGCLHGVLGCLHGVLGFCIRVWKQSPTKCCSELAMM